MLDRITGVLARLVIIAIVAYVIFEIIHKYFL
jgi:hypothetical protein